MTLHDRKKNTNKGSESLYTHYASLETRIITEAQSFFHLDKTGRYAFFALLLFAFNYLLPILLANVYYNDDLARSYFGYLGWRQDGRPLMEIPYFLLNNSRNQVGDFSPWMQIFATGIFSYCLTLFGRKLMPKASWFCLFTAVACVYFNFFMLENLSYRYDAFGMLLALSLPFAAFSLPDKWPATSKALLLSLLFLCSLSLYQATIGAYVGLLFFGATVRISHDEPLTNIGKEILWQCIALGMGAFIYKFLIVSFLTA